MSSTVPFRCQPIQQSFQGTVLLPRNLALFLVLLFGKPFLLLFFLFLFTFPNGTATFFAKHNSGVVRPVFRFDAKTIEFGLGATCMNCALAILVPTVQQILRLIGALCFESANHAIGCEPGHGKFL